MYKYTQRSFVGGRLDAELMGRQDLQKYYQGASELVNFNVRRQGLVTKRRGTELLCDISGLLGYSMVVPEGAEEGAQAEQVANAIGKSMLIPLVGDRETGKYILMTGRRAFVAGVDGILLMDGTWAREIEPYELVDYGDAAEEGSGAESGAEPNPDELLPDVRPFYVSIPYSDDELADVDYCQSGDTVFLAHENHQPAKIVMNGDSIKYAPLRFDFIGLHPPRIVSVTATGTWGKTSSFKTISYVATYVKDGIESAPSAEYQYAYSLPWGDDCRLEIKVDKGNNATEPDHYNIYKKEYSDFGLISSVNKNTLLLAYPDKPDGLSQHYYFQDFGEEYALKFSAILNKREFSPYKPGINGPGYDKDATYPQYTCPAGAFHGSSFTLEFGEAFGKVCSEFSMLLDGISIPSGAKLSIFYISDQWYRITMTLSGINSTDEKTIQITSHSSAPSVIRFWNGGLYNPVLQMNVNTIGGGNYFDWSYLAPTSIIFMPIIGYDNFRKLTVDFSEALTQAGITDSIESTSNTTGTKKYQTKSIKVEVFKNEELSEPGEVYFTGLSFGSTWGIQDTFQDDYISPDVSYTPPSIGDEHFTAAGDYPACVGIHKQRLVFAASKNEPFTFWMSAVGDLYNFTPHSSIREDDALEAELASTELPRINHIINSRDLMMMTDGGEWKVAPVSGNTLSYKTISADQQSAIGCASRLKPLLVGDEILFVKSGGETMLATRYNWSSDGYETQDLTVLSQWIFKNNPIVSMTYRQHPDSVVECVLADGTIANLVYMREHEVCAWSRTMLGGGWKAKRIASNKSLSAGSSDVMMVVERDGQWQLWRERDDVPVREVGNVPIYDHLCLDGMRELQDGDTVPEGMIEVAAGDKRLAGYVFSAELVTVRPEVQGQTSIQFELKNAKDAEIRILDSGDFSVMPYGSDVGTAAQTGAKLLEDGTMTLSSRDVRLLLMGDNTGDGRVRIVSHTPMPLNILSVSVNYEIHPLSNSNG